MSVVRKFLKSGLPWAVGLALAMQFVEYFGWVASAEGKLLDFFLDFETRDAPKDSPNFLAIEVDDADYEHCFIYSPMDPRGLKSIVDTVQEAGPKVIGVDIVTDSPQRQDIDNYADLRKYENVVWAAGVEHSSLEDPQTFGEWFTGAKAIAIQPTTVLGHDSSAANFQWAVPLYPRDEDLRVRRLPRRVLVPPGKVIRSWPSKIAALYRGKDEDDVHPEADELFIARASRNFPHFNLSHLFTCTEKARGTIGLTALPNAVETLRNAIGKERKAIVLIGGTFGSARDYYETPQGRISGLELNVNAIAAELAGSVVTEMPPWRRFLLDIFAGIWIFLVFDYPWESRSINLRIAWSFGGVVLALGIAALMLLWRHLVWLSIVGIAIGMVLHVLIELWKEDLQLEEKKHD